MEQGRLFSGSLTPLLQPWGEIWRGGADRGEKRRNRPE